MLSRQIIVWAPLTSVGTQGCHGYYMFSIEDETHKCQDVTILLLAIDPTRPRRQNFNHDWINEKKQALICSAPTENVNKKGSLPPEADHKAKPDAPLRPVKKSLWKQLNEAERWALNKWQKYLNIHCEEGELGQKRRQRMDFFLGSHIKTACLKEMWVLYQTVPWRDSSNIQ